MKCLILIIPIFICNWMFGQTPSNDPHWVLVWADNFNTLNTNIWLVQNNFDHYGGEPQVYTNRVDNVFVNNGHLVLRAKKETYSCPSGSINQWKCARQNKTGQPYDYTSGWVETKQAFNTQYGYIESRIKLPNGHGFWPAFWTYVGSGVSNNTNAAEIDIFEMLGSDYRAPHIVGTNIHLAYSGNLPDYGQDLIPVNFSYTSWHTYGIEWSPSKIIWYIDGYPSRIYPNPGVVDPVRIILNFALEPWAPPNQSTPFPADMIVDYVKVYELRKDCGTIMNVCNYNFALYDNKVKKKIIIGNGTCTNTVGVEQSVYLRTSEGVIINGDFTVPVGAELYIDVNPCDN